MAIVRVVDGKPSITWYWGIALWLPTGGVVTALLLVPFGLWALAQPVGTIPAGLVIGVSVAATHASLLAWWQCLRRLLRHVPIVASDAKPCAAPEIDGD